MNAVLHVNEKDNVVTCIRPLTKGEKIKIDGKIVTVNSDIPIFHKMAVTDIKKGALCYKYGEIIGDATEDIRAGDHVHVHNLESTRGRGDKRSKRNCTGRQAL